MRGRECVDGKSKGRVWSTMVRFNVTSYKIRGEVKVKEENMKQKRDQVPPNYGKFDHQMEETNPPHYGARVDDNAH